MVRITRPDTAQQVAALLAKMEAAMEEAFSYYKFGRHGNSLCEKPYFLLSHCSHLMFSLWLADQDSRGAIFAKTARPVAFTAGPDFEPLRYAEYSRRVLHADCLDEHLKNEPKWFAFWTRTLECLDPPRAVRFQKLSQRMLTYADHRGFLEQKASRKNRMALEDLMREDATGRLLLSSISVLEDLAWSIIRYLATLDPRMHAIDQITALIGLLSRIRRTIVCETPASGPYVPRTAQSWKMPLSPAWLYHIRTRGLLHIVPKREGGSIICHYTWVSDSDTKKRLWTVRTSSLRHPYEEELFKTWSHATGEYLQGSGGSPETKACWVVQTAEADHLESISREADILLHALWGYPVCRDLAETVDGIIRNGSRRWKPGELPWTYIEQLDRVIGKLKFICREAKVLGGDNPAERVIQQVWPVSTPTRGEHESVREEPVAIEAEHRAPTSSAEAPVPSDPEPASLGAPPYPCDEPEPASQTPLGDEPGREEPVGVETMDLAPLSSSETLVPGDPKPAASDEPPYPRDEPEPASQTPLGDEPGREEPVGVEATDLAPLSSSETPVPGDPEPAASDEPPYPCDEPEPASQTPLGDEPGREEPVGVEATDLAPLSSSETPVPSDPKPAASDEPPHPLAEPQLVSEPLVGEEPNSATPEDLLPHDTDAEPEQGTEQALPVPEAPYEEDSPPPHLTPRPVEPATCADDDLKQANDREADEADGSRLREIGNPLIQRLWEHHHGPEGPIRHKPLLLAEFEIDLGWKRSRVQREMTNLFGSKPFTKYKARCADGTILSFLDDLAGKSEAGIPDRTLCTSVR